MTNRQQAPRFEAYGSRVEFRVLGPVQALHGGAALTLGGPKQRTVLALLIASAGRPVPIGRLIEGLYGEDATSGAKRTIHTYVSNLRAQVGDSISRSGDGYQLTADTIDAIEFERFYREARDLLDDDPAQAGSLLRQALALWRGYAYADVEDRGVLTGEISRLEELRLAALEARIEADLAVGRHQELIGELEALTAEYPLRETLRSHHMLALYRSGRQSEALRAFGRTRTVLTEELGIDPSSELQSLEEMILSQDPKLDVRIKARIERRAVLAAELDQVYSSAAARDEALARRDSILEGEARRAKGSIVDVRGAAAIAEFPTVASAVGAASGLVPSAFRVAIDVGDLEIGDAAITGPPLIRALRLAAVAHPGQVLLSPEAHADLSSRAASGWASRSLGAHRIAGIDGDLAIHQLLVQGARTDFPNLMVDRLPPPLPVADGPSAVAGYELRDQLGAGASGIVYRAYQRALGREVALRVIRPDVVDDPRFIRRFEAELQRVSSAEHPHLAPLVDYWREPDAACMVSRLLTGSDLRSRLVSGLDHDTARTVLEQIGTAVHAAHQRGIAHGRLRPENVLFDDDGNAYLSDLGLASILHDIVTSEPDAYTAPERIAGHPSIESDVYSMGVLAAELMSGEPLAPDRGLPAVAPAIDEAVARATHPDPSNRHPSVVELLDELAEAAPKDAALGPGRTDIRNPYKGLASFQESDSADFFGRSELVAELVEAVDSQRLTLVVGPSGIGKSSAVRAGLIPAVRAGGIDGSETWLVTDMFPGSRPFDALAEALERVAVSTPVGAVERMRSGMATLDEVVSSVTPIGSTVLLVVDQFEELFTHLNDEETRRRFLDVLAGTESGANRSVRVVATMRADFYDRPLRYAGFGELIADRTVAVHAPSRSELEEIVRGPGGRVGLAVTDGLVDALVSDADREPGALPLLQHALSEIFESRDADVLDVRQYRASGGLAGSIGRRGEQIYLGFAPDERSFVREVFLRLVTVDEDSEDTRRRVRRSELEGIDRADVLLDRVLEAFGRHRLLVFDRDPATRGPTVEVAHEALIGEWDRLQGWVDEARDDLLMRRQVEVATRHWVDSDADPSYLLIGGRLERAEAWRDESGMYVGTDEHAFLVESRRADDADRERTRRNRRRVIAALSVALLVALIGGSIAYVQRGIARRETIAARTQDLSTQAQSVINDDPELAILLALEAYHTAQGLGGEVVPGDVMTALHEATQASRLLARATYGSFALAVSRDGLLVAVDDPSDAHRVTVLDARTLEVRTVIESRWPVGGLQFSPDASRIYVSHFDHYGQYSQAELEAFPGAGILDISTGRLVRVLDSPCCYQRAHVSDSGSHLLLSKSDKPPVVIDLEGDREALTFSRDVKDADLVPGEDALALLTDAGIETLDLQTRLRSLSQAIEIEGFPQVRVAAQGSTAIVSDFTQDVRISHPSGETVVVDAPGVQDAVFDGSGARIAVMGNSDQVLVVDADTEDTLSLPGHGSGSWVAEFSADGERLYVMSLTNGLFVWDISPSGRDMLGNFKTSGDLFAVGPVSEDGVFVAGGTPTGDSFFEWLEFETGTTEEAARRGAVVDRRRPWISSDGSWISSLDAATGQAYVADVDSGATLAEYDRCETVTSSAEAYGLVVIRAEPDCPSDHTSRVETLRGDVLLDFGRDQSMTPRFAAFGPKGTPSEGLLVISHDYMTMSFYDTSDGRLLGSFPSWAVFVPNFSQDGTHLVAGTQLPEFVTIDIGAFRQTGDLNVAMRIVPAGERPAHFVTIGSRYAVTTQAGEEVQVFLAATWQPWFSVSTHTTNTAVALVAVDDRYAYYEDDDGVIRRIVLDVEELIELARSSVTRDFTLEECERFLYDTDCSVYAEE